MSSYYIYLISSLAMLHFNNHSVISLEDFISRCKRLIPEKDLNFIKQVISVDAYALKLPKNNILSKWKEFDLALRNELAFARASRRKINAEKFLYPNVNSDINITHIAQSALRQASILEAEKYLDLERWRVLDELVMGHYFDLDFLLIYAIKLSILERWVRIGSRDKLELMNKILPN